MIEEISKGEFGKKTNPGRNFQTEESQLQEESRERIPTEASEIDCARFAELLQESRMQFIDKSQKEFFKEYLEVFLKFSCRNHKRNLLRQLR